MSQKKNKILYLGVYRDSGGWSQASRDYILAMDSVGLDVVPRHIKLDNSFEPIPERLVELEKKDAAGCNIVIQHILPHLMTYDGSFDRCIGLFASETSNFIDSNWAENLNTMDEIWTINEQQMDAYFASGSNKRTNVVPHAINLEKFNEYYEPFPFTADLSNSTIFYYVGEFSRRKNLGDLIKAFHGIFDAADNVELVLKLNRPSVDSEKLRGEITNFCQEVKKGLKRFTRPELYKSEIIITERLSEKDLMRLHNSCDCFVNPSYGEAFCLPLMDAYLLGNSVITGDKDGPSFYTPLGQHFEQIMEPCFGSFDAGLPNLYTSNESWFVPNILEMQQLMKDTHEYIQSNGKNKEDRSFDKMRFSYETIGNRIKELLEI